MARGTVGRLSTKVAARWGSPRRRRCSLVRHSPRGAAPGRCAALPLPPTSIRCSRLPRHVFTLERVFYLCASVGFDNAACKRTSSVSPGYPGYVAACSGLRFFDPASPLRYPSRGGRVWMRAGRSPWPKGGTMSRQRSLLTVIHDVVRQEVGSAISSLLGGMSTRKKSKNGRRRRRRKHRRGTWRPGGPGRPPKAVAEKMAQKKAAAATAKTVRRRRMRRGGPGRPAGSKTKAA